MLSSIISFVTGNLKSTLIGGGVFLAICLGVYVQGCNDGETRQATKSAEKIAALEAKIVQLQTLVIETKEEVKPAPIKFGPVRGTTTATSDSVTDQLKKDVERLVAERRERDALVDSARSEIKALRAMNYDLASAFEREAEGNLIVNDTLLLPYRLWMRAEPLNQYRGLESLHHLISIAQLNWWEKTITQIQRIPIDRSWWEIPLVIVLAIGAIVGWIL